MLCGSTPRRSVCRFARIRCHRALGLEASQPSARTIAGVPLLVSPSVAADTIWAIPRDHVLFVIRQDASVVTDSSVFFTKDSVAVRATIRVGFAYSYPLAITKISKT